MPPRRASTGAKKRVVRTVRSTRLSAASANAASEPEETPAPEAPEENPISETRAPSEAPVIETPAAADEVVGGSPTPREITPETLENPTLGTPASVEPAAAGETAAAMEVDTAGTPAPEVIPQSAEAPALADERKADESVTVMEEDKVTTGCPATDISPQDAGLEARSSDPVPGGDAAQGEEARVVGAAEAGARVTGAVPVVKKIKKIVRKVTRRVPVKRTPNKKEPEPTGVKEDKGNEGGEETAPLPAEKEQNPCATQPVSAPIEEINCTGAEAEAEAVPLSVECQNPNGAETRPMPVEGEYPSGAEAVSIIVEEHKPASDPDQPSAPGEPSSHVEATTSADGGPPVVVPQKRVRMVKKIIVVKRTVKAKVVPKKEEKTEETDDGKKVAPKGEKMEVADDGKKVAPKGEKMEEADVGKKVAQKGENMEEVDDGERVAQKEKKMEEAHEGTVEKIADPGCDANTSEPSKDDKPDLETEAASIPDGSLKTEEDVALESRLDDSEKGESSRNIDTEQDMVEGEGASIITAADEMVGMSERQKRRKTEIFIGGLDREAKEDDIRKVFEKVGEVVEVRMMMDKKTGKNKGYAFLRYVTPAQAKQAVTEFNKVEVCGKQCGAAALEGNDTIFLGNIDKKWAKEDVSKLLHEIGIEKIDTVTLMPDPKNPECNRGFAFLDFETNKDAQAAFKKLQQKDAFGKGRNIKVAWAEPLVDPDDEEMQKVKSVFAEGIPSNWDEKNVKEHFKRFGQIERVVLSRNMHSAKRKDFAFVNFTTREAALHCIESFEKDTTDSGSKVNVKVSLAKPVQKSKQFKAGVQSNMKDNSKAKPKAVPRESKVNLPVKSQSSRGPHGKTGEDKLSTNRELLHVPREQAAWKQHTYPRGPDYSSDLHGRKRPLSAVGDTSLYPDPRGYPRARVNSAHPVAYTSYSSVSHGPAAASLEYYQQPSVRYGTGSLYGAVDAPRTYDAPRGYGAVEAPRTYGAVDTSRTYGTADASRTYQVRPGASAHGGGHYSRYMDFQVKKNQPKRLPKACSCTADDRSHCDVTPFDPDENDLMLILYPPSHDRRAHSNPFTWRGKPGEDQSGFFPGSLCT